MHISANIGLKILLCRTGSVVCGLRLENIAETMRPLPIETVSGMPEFVSGVSIIRGAPVPVVDLARLLGQQSEATNSRFVLVRADGRHVALSVAEVMGIRTLDARSLEALPPLLLGGAHAEFVTALGALDAHLLLVLESGRILPESVWSDLRVGGDGA
jgi:purine-binding chemotaxis protein CheW